MYVANHAVLSEQEANWELVVLVHMVICLHMLKIRKWILEANPSNIFSRAVGEMF